MKWVKGKSGRFSQRPHYLPGEIDDECERVVREFLTKRYGEVEFPPDSALLASAKLFREEKKIHYPNLAVSSEHGQQLITLVTSTFQSSRDAARVRLLKHGILADGGGNRTAELF